MGKILPSSTGFPRFQPSTLGCASLNLRGVLLVSEDKPVLAVTGAKSNLSENGPVVAGAETREADTSRGPLVLFPCSFFPTYSGPTQSPRFGCGENVLWTWLRMAVSGKRNFGQLPSVLLCLFRLVYSLSLSLHDYIYTVYIYIERERYLCIYICIYLYV